MLDEPDDILFRLRREGPLGGSVRLLRTFFGLIELPQLAVSIFSGGLAGLAFFVSSHLGFQQIGFAELARLDQAGINMLLNRQHRVNEPLHPVNAVGHRVTGDPVGCGRHALNHIPVRHGEAHIIFEKIAVSQNVGYD
ncbi:hypothetical protein D3C75_250940 [compost metagenome]